MAPESALISWGRGALIVTRRELRDQLRDWRILAPILLLTLLFPGLMNFTAAQALNFVGRYGATLVGERLIPFLMMIVGFFPITVSLVIALESFVGEKERHSLEPLLSSPLSDGQLYLGKLLAALVPPLVGSYLGITVYLVGIYRSLGWLPPGVLLLQVLLLSLVQALVMVSGAVVISAQTTSVRAANLLSSFIIIPMALLIQGESVVMFWGRYETLWVLILGQALLAGLFVRTGVTHFNREELLGRDLDALNLRGSWRVFWDAFRHGSVGVALSRILLPTAAMLLALAAGYWAGTRQAQVLVVPDGFLQTGDLGRGLIARLDAFGFLSATGVGLIWFQNVRAVLIATLMGVFSFGVLGVIILMLPLMLIGFLAATLGRGGLPPSLFLTALVLPHGLLEIPAIALSGAAILRLGATLAAPAEGRTIGEAWLAALADWLRLFLLVIAPLFLLAALIEVFVTPYIAARLLGGG
jgi:uncharacterized membrane protein SpoIIM required for sporulation